ncbi:MAG: DUF4405 domain-containing protein [Chloroflexota bacterium]|nr:MAG: DUF4405 domain-containing protein [Chloroflexota bacterium]
MKQKLAKRIVQWLLLAVVILYVITGFGITEYRTVEHLTFGLLSKPLSFNIHNNLIIPFIILVGLHIYQRIRKASEV